MSSRVGLPVVVFALLALSFGGLAAEKEATMGGPEAAARLRLLALESAAEEDHYRALVARELVLKDKVRRYEARPDIYLKENETDKAALRSTLKNLEAARARIAKLEAERQRLGLVRGGDTPEKAKPGPGDSVETLLRQAFPGDDRPLSASIRVHRRASGLLIAAETFQVLADGRVKMTDCAIARFVKGSPVTTVRAAEALFRLDGPVSELSHLGSRKIVSVDMPGGVRLTSEE